MGKTVLHLVILSALTLVAYSNTFQADFVAGDIQFIAKSRQIRDPGPLQDLLFKDYWGSLSDQRSGYYRPLTMLSKILDFRLYGLNPTGFHATNFFLHLANVFLLYGILSLLFSNRIARLLPALFFALHPAHPHAVTYISARNGLLATFFLLTSFLLYWKASKKNRLSALFCYGLSILLFFPGMLSKESAVTLPLLLFLSDATLDRKSPKQLCSLKEILQITPYLILLLMYFLLRAWAVGGYSDPYDFALDPVCRILTVFKTLGWSLRKLLVPINLSYIGDVLPAITPGDAAAWISVPPVCAVATLAWIFRKKSPALSFGLGWILITLLPASQIFLIPAMGNANLLYLPSIGLGICFGALLNKALEQVSSRQRFLSKTTMKWASSGLVLVFLLATMHRNLAWQDSYSLSLDSLNKLVPLNPEDRNNPALLRMIDDRAVLENNLGLACVKKGDPGQAILHFSKALDWSEEFIEARLNLGRTLEKLGNHSRAIEEYRKAILIYPLHSEAHRLHAALSAKTGLLNRAESELNVAIRINPDNHRAYSDLGCVQILQGNWNGALRSFRKSLSHSPNDPICLFNLGYVYSVTGRYGMALDAYKRCIRLQPNNAAALWNMAEVLNAIGRNKEAEAVRARAREVGKRSKETRRQGGKNRGDPVKRGVRLG